MSVCVCVYIYIYIYIYIWMYMCGSLCVLVVLISSIFEVAPECPGEPFFVYFGWRPHKELCLQKPARIKDISQSGVKLQSRRFVSLGVRHQSGGSDIQSSGYEAGQSRTNIQSKKMMTRWVSIFGSCVELSLSCCDSHT